MESIILRTLKFPFYKGVLKSSWVEQEMTDSNGEAYFRVNKIIHLQHIEVFSKAHW